MDEGEGGSCYVEIPIALLMYESSPRFAAQELGEGDPRSLQLAQPLGGPLHPLVVAMSWTSCAFADVLPPLGMLLTSEA